MSRAPLLSLLPLLLWPASARALGVAHLLVASLAGIAATLASVPSTAPASAGPGEAAHAVVLVFAALLPALLGGFGNLAVSALPGVRATACPTVGRLGLWGAVLADFAAVPALLASLSGPSVSGVALIAVPVLALAACLAASLDLGVTILSGRGSSGPLLELPPDVIGTLIGSLVLVVVVPSLAALATSLWIAHAAGWAASLSRASVDPLCCALLPLAAGLVWRSVRASRPGPATANAAMLLLGTGGVLVWADHLVSHGPVPMRSIAAGAFLAVFGAYGAVALIAIARDLLRRTGRLGLVHGDAVCFILAAGLGLAQRASGTSAPHSGLGLALLFAAFAAFETEVGRDGGIGARGLRAMRFWALASGAAMTLAGGAFAAPAIGAAGAALATLAALAFACTVCVACLRSRFVQPDRTSPLSTQPGI